ncbi:hypothetical protein PENTCL1PPCAC_19865 [Pristionchus entomophagus]|uniref:G protein-coupled receptor n=1 Tax=Pristionchus entomophagus TaxID=358040 RepID=A0AAV5TT90_9BILA|nr:hypothetical protein PENTCL1PPCAC_19865 [Pristionchus entomophagus]
MVDNSLSIKPGRTLQVTCNVCFARCIPQLLTATLYISVIITNLLFMRMESTYSARVVWRFALEFTIPITASRCVVVDNSLSAN